MSIMSIVSVYILTFIINAISISPTLRGTWKYMNSTKSYNSKILNIPPRIMWGWGTGLSGYCGECSIQSVGLYYGNYISQELVRYSDGNEELLIGVNDEKAAKTLQYVYEEWDYNKKTPQDKSFKSWLKEQLDNNYPVISGFYERMKKGTGDEDYDHIMPIIGYTLDSNNEISGLYHNDLYKDEVSLTTADFSTRNKCYQDIAPVQPYDYCLPVNVDYGIVIKGFNDPLGETFRAEFEISMNYEPDYGAEDKLHQKPIPFDGVLHISGLTAGESYACLRFDNVKDLPSKGGFLNASFAARFNFIASSSTHDLNVDTTMSDGSYFYRCVKA